MRALRTHGEVHIEFQLFGTAHVVTLVICTVVAVAARQVGSAMHGTARASRIAVGIAVALIAVEWFKTWLAIDVYDQPWTENLPLHLCRISSYLCAAMLVFRSYRVFEVAYFWGIGGSVSAMLTPDLAQAFPHPNYLGFFIGHGLVLSSILFAISGFGFRPTFRSIGVTAAVSAVYMAVLAVINLLLDTNYLYLCAKPEGASPYDYLGPWPYYILGIWAVGFVVSLVLYAPFAALARYSR